MMNQQVVKDNIVKITRRILAIRPNSHKLLYKFLCHYCPLDENDIYRVLFSIKRSLYYRINGLRLSCTLIRICEMLAMCIDSRTKIALLHSRNNLNTVKYNKNIVSKIDCVPNHIDDALIVIKEYDCIPPTYIRETLNKFAFAYLLCAFMRYQSWGTRYFKYHHFLPIIEQLTAHDMVTIMSPRNLTIIFDVLRNCPRILSKITCIFIHLIYYKGFDPNARDEHGLSLKTHFDHMLKIARPRLNLKHKRSIQQLESVISNFQTCGL